MLKTAMLIGFVILCSMTPCSAQTRQLTAPEKQIIANAYGARLKDPASAQYRWAALPLTDNLKGGKLAYCFQVNAKNSYGGYTGFKLILGTLKRVNGKIVAFNYVTGNLDDAATFAQMTADLCRASGISF
jgi:hypothetical protein